MSQVTGAAKVAPRVAVTTHVFLFIPNTSARLALSLIAPEYPDATTASGAVLVPITPARPAASIIAYLRLRRVAVLGSCVVSRHVAEVRS